MTETLQHFHLHKLIVETTAMVIMRCDCGHVITEMKSQTTIFPALGKIQEKSTNERYEVPTINRSQIKRIYGLAANIPLNNEELHQVVLAETGEEHISMLKFNQARAVTSKLKEIWDKKPGRISNKQMGKIWKLGFKLHWSKPAVNKFCKRITGKANPFKLSIAEGNTLIKAMAAMIKHDKTKKK